MLNNSLNIRNLPKHDIITSEYTISTRHKIVLLLMPFPAMILLWCIYHLVNLYITHKTVKLWFFCVINILIKYLVFVLLFYILDTFFKELYIPSFTFVKKMFFLGAYATVEDLLRTYLMHKELHKNMFFLYIVYCVLYALIWNLFLEQILYDIVGFPYTIESEFWNIQFYVQVGLTIVFTFTTAIILQFQCL